MSTAAADIDPLFLALAQPLLRSPSGQTLQVLPHKAQRIIAQPPSAAWIDRARWCWGHSQPADALPWLATDSRIHLLLDGHRPLTIAPTQGWGHGEADVMAPYPSVVCAAAAGLWFFFVNAGRSVRLFAVDAERAVECEPIADAQVFAAWAGDGALWAAGMVPRRTLDTHTAFGQALVLRLALRPVKLDRRWSGRALCRVSEPLQQLHAAALADLAGIEAWLAALPNAHAADAPCLLAAPLQHRHADELAFDSSLLGPPSPGDYTALWLARTDEQPASAGVPCGPAAPLLVGLREQEAFVTACRVAPHEQQVFTSAHGTPRWGRASAAHLRVARWNAHEAALGAAADLSIQGLPAAALDAPLAGLDVIHHPDFGFAAALAWLPPSHGGDPVRRAGALMHSDDAQRWRVLQPLT